MKTGNSRSFPSRMRSAWLYFLLPVIAMAQPAPPAAPATPEQWHGAYGGSEEFSTATAQTQPRWQALWSWINQAPPRALNPSAEMAVMVHLGRRPSGGYRVRIERTSIEAGHFVVEFAEDTPPSDGLVTQALTQPWAIAVVPLSKLPVVFRARPVAAKK
jgi:hypothetical protein